jgi:hypothetical protein
VDSWPSRNSVYWKVLSARPNMTDLRASLKLGFDDFSRRTSDYCFRHNAVLATATHVCDIYLIAASTLPIRMDCESNIMQPFGGLNEGPYSLNNMTHNCTGVALRASSNQLKLGLVLRYMLKPKFDAFAS